jgi:hypothetical protein
MNAYEDNMKLITRMYSVYFLTILCLLKHANVLLQMYPAYVYVFVP